MAWNISHESNIRVSKIDSKIVALRSIWHTEHDFDIVRMTYAREMIYNEELHLGEVDKMLRNPGDMEPFNK